MAQVIVTRAAPQAAATAARLAAQGHTPILSPMLQIARESAPSGLAARAAAAQAILFTSAAGADAYAAANLPTAAQAFAVGEATAMAVRAAGFADVIAAAGGARRLADLVTARLSPSDGPILYISGDPIAAPLDRFLRGGGFNVERAILYRSLQTQALTARALAALAQGQVEAILFHSARAAAAFEAALGGADLSLQRTAALCISPAIARGLSRSDWGCVRAAQTPTESALLGLLADLAAAQA